MRRLWRWLCCRTGHHRETVDLAICTGFPPRLIARCLDCDRWRTLATGLRRTPSRRYALRGKA